MIGPEASISALVAAAILPLAVAGSGEAVELAAALALLVAACFLVARVLRLGWIADYFSRPVLVGYLHGVARSAKPHDAVLGWVDRLGRYGDVADHRSARVTPGVVVYRLDDRLFFANSGYVEGRVLEAVRGAPGPVRCLVFDAEGVSHVDATGLAALNDLRETLGRENVELVLARAKTPLLERLREAGFDAPSYPTVRSAVEAGTEA